MTKKYRIWFDQDSVVYDLSSVWYALHNKDFPNHDLRVEDVDGWDTSAQCKKNNCAADIYSYFNYPQVWSDGNILGDADKYIERYSADERLELGFLTTAANILSTPYKIEWLQNNFPYVKDIVINYKSHIKHLLRGDILVDDAIHNLTNWQGIAILFSHAWNQQDNDLLRATGDTDSEKWDHVDWLIRRSLSLLDEGLSHKTVERILISEQRTVYK